MYCRERAILWAADAPEPDCGDAGHRHIESELHRHRARVVLPSGVGVFAVSFDPLDPYGRDAPPDHGVYLDPRWSPPWGHEHVDWPDFGLPANVDAMRATLAQVLERAGRGEAVEIGCLGGHGRTGTALACLAVLDGVPAAEAVAWVRDAHCTKAVETPDQIAFVESFGDGD